MVIRGNARGNGRQLASYLLAQKDNEDIRILDIDGQTNPDPKDLHRALFAMDISSELTKSEKGLYHAQINPAPGEDLQMTDGHWLKAADILSSQLGLENQRRAIVLHTKKERTHAHVVWERYDHDNGKMISDSFSRLAQDRARKEMELVFEQKLTPHRNKHRPELKAQLTELWGNTSSGAEFIRAANKHGYLLGEGVGRHPFMVVDENARSHDLARQLKGVRLKEIRERLRNEKLVSEKKAIEQARMALEKKGQNSGKGRQGQQGSQNTLERKASLFAGNRDDMFGTASKEVEKQKRIQKIIQQQQKLNEERKKRKDKGHDL